MSMFTVSGKVINVFDQKGKVDEETGEISPTTPRLQLLGDMPMPDGQVRMDMITVKVENKRAYEDLLGQDIRLPIGVFSPSKGQIVYYVPKGSTPVAA